MRSFTQPARWLRAAATWPVTSVQGSRRNALVASTALAQSRRELLDVEGFLATHQARWDERRSGATTRTA